MICEGSDMWKTNFEFPVRVEEGQKTVDSRIGQEFQVGHRDEVVTPNKSDKISRKRVFINFIRL